MLDDPGAQDQYPAMVDLEGGGGLLVVGTGGSGKTTALRTLAASAALAATSVAGSGEPGLTIFGLDFASRELTVLSALGACAAVATGDELEGVTRIIAVLDAELQRRRSAVAAATRQGDRSPRHARVLLLIDDYGNLAQTFEGTGAAPGHYQWLELVNRVIVDGRQVGIHCALTATRRAAVKASVLSAVTNRIVLRQVDRGAYVELGVPAAAIADSDELPPGRGFLNGPTVIQLASLAGARPEPPGAAARGAPNLPLLLGGQGGGPAAGAAAAGERDALRALAASLGGRADALLVTEPLPAEIGLSAAAPSGAPPSPLVVPLGVSDLDLAVVELDLAAANLTVIGDPRSGRSTALASIGHHLAVAGCEVWAAGPAGSPLALVDNATRSVFGRAAEIAAMLDELAAVAGEAGQARPVLLIDDLDLLEDPVLDPPAARLASAGVRYAASTVSLRGYSANAIAQDMKKARALLYLRPPGGREVQEATGSAPRIRPGLPMVPGRGVLVVNRVPTVLQVANYFADR
jgi:S-DNA-T family DNA segregation ATPase FtsK/SpoIIIE